ncbi:hypothetical protein PRNP1_012478 [Phytophthora ramorum]
MPHSHGTPGSKSNLHACTKLEGATTFKLPPSQTYHYLLSLKSGKLRISLEDCDSKKKWCTNELELENYVNSSNSIPDASASDYIECFHELLVKPLDRTTKTPRSLQNTKGDRLILEIYVNVQVLMKYRTATFTFDLGPVSVERIDILESKVQDLQREVKCLHAETASKSAADQAMQKMISDLRAEMNSLREARSPGGTILARATSQLGLEGVVLWRCEGLKVTDGVIRDLKPGVYQVNATVGFESCQSSTHLQLVKGTQLVCSTSGFHQLTLTSIIHAEPDLDDFLELEGTTKFSPPPAPTYRYSLSLQDGKLRIWLEGCDSKKQWCTARRSLCGYVDLANAIPTASAADYVKYFHDLIDANHDGVDSFPITFQPLTGNIFQLQIVLKVQVMGQPRVATYTFTMEPISLERFDVMESKVRDLKSEVSVLRSSADQVAATHHSDVQKLQSVVHSLSSALKKLNGATDQHCKNWVGLLQLKAPN